METQSEFERAIAWLKQAHQDRNTGKTASALRCLEMAEWWIGRARKHLLLHDTE